MTYPSLASRSFVLMWHFLTRFVPRLFATSLAGLNSNWFCSTINEMKDSFWNDKNITNHDTRPTVAACRNHNKSHSGGFPNILDHFYSQAKTKELTNYKSPNLHLKCTNQLHKQCQELSKNNLFHLHCRWQFKLHIKINTLNFFPSLNEYW